MTLYIDSSALVKYYLDEDDSGDARAHLSDPDWVCAGHTFTETWRALHRAVVDDEVGDVIALLEDDWPTITVVSLDHALCRRAGILAIATGTRTLDALHLAAAERAGGRSLTFLTYDVRLAIAARGLGFPVVGS